jgi:hypothetical protein
MKAEDRDRKIERKARQRADKFRSGVLLGRSPVEMRDARAWSRRYKQAARRVLVAESACDKACEEAGVPVLARFWYKVFSRQVGKLWRNHPPRVYAAELPALMFRWENRGLDANVLHKVEQAVVEALEELQI